MKKQPQPIDFSLEALARDEVRKWHWEVRPLIVAALFCFCHRLTTGKTFEECFSTKSKPTDWTDYSI